MLGNFSVKAWDLTKIRWAYFKGSHHGWYWDRTSSHLVSTKIRPLFLTETAYRIMWKIPFHEAIGRPVFFQNRKLLRIIWKQAGSRVAEWIVSYEHQEISSIQNRLYWPHCRACSEEKEEKWILCKQRNHDGWLRLKLHLSGIISL